MGYLLLEGREKKVIEGKEGTGPLKLSTEF